MLPALITGGLSLLGGLVGKRSRDSDAEFNQSQSEHMHALTVEENQRQEGVQLARARESDALQLAMADRSEALQREFAQMGIRWKVADARAAGLHPVYGAGLGGAVSTPITIQPQGVTGGSSASPSWTPRSRENTLGASLGQMGQEIGRALMAQENAEERAARAADLELKAAMTRREFAQAAYWENEAQRVKADVTVSPMPVESPVRFRELPPLSGGSAGLRSGAAKAEAFGSVKPKADEPVSASGVLPHTTAGVHPGFMRYTIVSDGRRRLQALLPFNTEGWAEAWSELGPLDKARVIKLNMDTYGESWLRHWLEMTPMGSPGATGSWEPRVRDRRHDLR